MRVVSSTTGFRKCLTAKVQDIARARIRVLFKHPEHPIGERAVLNDGVPAAISDLSHAWVGAEGKIFGRNENIAQIDHEVLRVIVGEAPGLSVAAALDHQVQAALTMCGRCFHRLQKVF